MMFIDILYTFWYQMVEWMDEMTGRAAARHRRLSAVRGVIGSRSSIE